MTEQLTFGDLPPVPTEKYPWLHAPLTREEQVGKDMIERLNNEPATARSRGPSRFDPEHDPELQDEFTPRAKSAG